MNNEFVMVPRELVDASVEWLEFLSEPNSAERSVAGELRAILDQPAAQHQEPVACATIRVERLDGHLCATVARFDVGRLPVGSLADVYTHADTGEVERLRDQVDQWHDRCVERTTERDTLRAQLAERDVLIQRCLTAVGSYSGELYEELRALSASAEPSAIPFPGYPPVPEDRKLPAEPSAPKCKYCNGTGGIKKGGGSDSCPVCHGSGEIVEGAPVEMGQVHYTAHVDYEPRRHTDQCATVKDGIDSYGPCDCDALGRKP